MLIITDKRSKEVLEEKALSEKITRRTSKTSLRSLKFIPESIWKLLRSQAASVALECHSGLHCWGFHFKKQSSAFSSSSNMWPIQFPQIGCYMCKRLIKGFILKLSLLRKENRLSFSFCFIFFTTKFMF